MSVVEVDYEVGSIRFGEIRVKSELEEQLDI